VDRALEGSILRGSVIEATDPRGAIAFAEKVLELLDEGRYEATYKYAVLLALIDVCLEQTQKSVRAPRHRDRPFHAIVITHSTAS